MFIVTTATKKVNTLLLNKKCRIKAIQGGTSASKTISIILLLISLAQSDETPTLTSIVSETLPHLKRGAMRDFLTIMKEHGYFQDARWNMSDFYYTFESGSKIEFFSADQVQKVRGLRRDRLFLNEANNVTHDVFDQLEIRTKEFIFLDWNPTNEFWFYTETLMNRTDVGHIILTYKDNEALSKEIINSIEQHKHNKQWWKVYGEGQLGEVDGKIYRDWKFIDEIPHTARLERYGLDFGYSNDPTAIVAVYYHDGGYILDEVVFTKGMSNKQIADTLKEIPKALVVADSAEPKSVDEIKSHGINIVGVSKKSGDTKQASFNKWAIGLVQDQRISVTKSSTNVIKEYRNYLWQTDRDGKILNVPEHSFSHSMDSVKYAFVALLNKPTFVMPKATEPLAAYYGSSEMPF